MEATTSCRAECASAVFLEETGALFTLTVGGVLCSVGAGSTGAASAGLPTRRVASRSPEVASTSQTRHCRPWSPRTARRTTRARTGSGCGPPSSGCGETDPGGVLKNVKLKAQASLRTMGMERRSVVKAALLLSLSGVRARRGMDSRIPFTAVCTSGLFAAWYSQSRHRRSSSLSDLVWAPIFDDTVELSSVASRRCRPFTLVDRD